MRTPVKNPIKDHQIALPKGVRDRMSIADEEIIYSLIDFAYKCGEEAGYADGYGDGQADAL